MSADLKQQFRAMAQGAQSLAIAYIGVVNGLFVGLNKLGHADALAAAAGLDAAYVRRWCDAAYAFLYLEAESDTFRLAENGAAMLPDAPGALLPMAARFLNLNSTPSLPERAKKSHILEPAMLWRYCAGIADRSAASTLYSTKITPDRSRASVPTRLLESPL